MRGRDIGASLIAAFAILSSGCTDGRISFPDPARPWVGAVFIQTNRPVTAWSVDGKSRLISSSDAQGVLLDTRTLADGEHTLSIDLGGSTVEERFQVANGPAVEPAITGRFADITESAKIADPFANGSGMTRSGAVAGDLDGDGDVDLFAWSSIGRVLLQTGPLTFESMPLPIPDIRAAGLGDLDGDGLLDVVAVGTQVHILHNTGGGMLVDVAAGSGLDSLPMRDFRGVTIADIDGDGLLDIALGQFNCGGVKGAPNLILRNEGDLRFADVTKDLGLGLTEAATFTLAIDVLDADDVLHVWPFHEGCTDVRTQHFRFAPGDDLPRLIDAVTPEQNESPMGSTILDGNADGKLDLWISGDSANPLWAGPDLLTSDAPYVGLDAFPDAQNRPLQAWSQALVDLDLDGRPDVVATHVDLRDAQTSSGAAPLAAYWQSAPGRFREVAAGVGLDFEGSCQALHGVDLDLDGDTDLLLGCVNDLRAFRNDLVDPSAGRTVILHGSISNPDGIHAILTTPSGERRVTRGGGQPFAGGLVRETVRAPSGKIHVRWPSGIEQDVDAGKGPVLEVTEPKVYTVSPRRVSVASPQEVAVAVSPAELGDAGADVKVTASAGTWAKAMAKGADGVWRGALSPPKARSTVVLEIAVGATKLKTRPRIFVR